MVSFVLMIIMAIIELATKMPLWVFMLTVAIFWVGILVESLINSIRKLAVGVAKAADEMLSKPLGILKLPEK